ncbi:hypothetical protein H6G00_01880 [Leptolyngbya sp. FACHB-541]|uniref:hypothetical protein n=1 Tax=Leptolyngbya sp. FACHB-541 TaxID=2692810 RepID=UPI0016826796|nr:hypothetical protein [Leptolyngbya sp. FACHB-541]MBD1995381.1 hypothetical protein [Leptolyngbya sp. FACHB-541]
MNDDLEQNRLLVERAIARATTVENINPDLTPQQVAEVVIILSDKLTVAVRQIEQLQKTVNEFRDRLENLERGRQI